MPRIIEKKILPKYFELIKAGKKTFEVRLADFEIEESDILILKEWDPERKTYTGRELSTKVTYVTNTKIMEQFHPKEEIEEKGLYVIAIKPTGKIEVVDLREVAEEELPAMEYAASSALIDFQKHYDGKQVEALLKVNTTSALRKLWEKGFNVAIVKINGGTSGFVVWKDFGNEIEIIKLFVHKSQQGKGLGTALINHVKGFGKPIKLDSAILPKTLAFYKKQGFKELERKEKEIGGVKLPVVVMRWES
jgi:GNAT superfamily N-acetyltransferase/ASC-1-like (ASCH) protein